VADGFYDMIDGLIGDIFRQSSKISRLAQQCNQEQYQVSFLSFLCFYGAPYASAEACLTGWPNAQPQEWD